VKEAAELSQHPSADYSASPLEDNIFEWHFTLRGPPSPSPFANGLYHGRITLPSAYPLRPPSFRFLTPSGRFECNREICLSISGFHEESWQPAWGIRTALLALRGHMDVEARGQVGGIDSDAETRKRLARSSGDFACPNCGKSNSKIMEEQERLVAEHGEDGKKMEEKVPEELRLAYREDLGKKEDEPQIEAEAQAPKEESTPQPQTPQEPVVQPAEQTTAQLQQQEQPRRAQARAGSEDAWLEMGIWIIGAILAILIARKVLVLFFT
jgi:ubiquitin-conjugating enzyme E2 J1